jgi:metal-responsive CopG/Arc/MetJ family transcriptional regulator
MATKVKVVSLSMPKDTLRGIDQLARSQGRSRSSFVARELERIIADSAKPARAKVLAA